MTTDVVAAARLSLAITRAVAERDVSGDSLGEVLDTLLDRVRAAAEVALAEVWLRGPGGDWYRRGVADDGSGAARRLGEARRRNRLGDVPDVGGAGVAPGDPTAVLVRVGPVEHHDVLLVLLGGLAGDHPELVREVLGELAPSLHRAAFALVRDLDLRRLAHEGQDLTFVADLQTTGMWLGPSFAGRLGLTGGWLERGEILDHVHPEDREVVTAARAALSRSVGPDEFVLRLRTSDGAFPAFTWRLWVVLDERRLYGVGREVTAEVRDRAFDQARRQALEGFLAGVGLQATLDRLALALEERLPASMVSIERRQVGSSRPRLVSAPSAPTDVAELLSSRAFSEVSRARDPYAPAVAVVDIATDRAWGRHAPLRSRLLDLGFRGRWNVPLVDGEGEWVGSLAVYRPDAPPPTADEEDVLLGQAALTALVLGHSATAERRREGEERFRLLAGATTEAIWDWDLQTGRHWWSPGFSALFGYAPEELPDDSRAWTDHIHPEDHDWVLASIQTIIDGDSADDEWTVEYRFLHADGTPRWVLDRGRAIRDDAGHVIRMVGGLIDVTDRYEVDEQRLRVERMESIGVLTGGVAHDLNNVLAPIMMAAGMLVQEDLDDHLQEAAEIIQESAQRGADMIRQILTFVRGATEQRQLLRLDDALVGLQRLVRDALAPAVGLEVTLPSYPLHVVGDMTQIQQLLMNLAVNARDAMPHGGTVDIVVDEVDVDETWAASVPEARPGRYVRVRVVDTGVGMPPEVAEQVFEPFFTTKDPGQGTGLGLSTALAIVRAHEGFITVRSTAGRGSTFTVHLPSARGAADAPTTATTPAAPRADGLTVLVIDDEAAVRTILQQSLARHGFRVMVAADGAEGVAMFAQHRAAIDAVITDVLMPVMDGIATIRAIRRIEPGVPVVVVSGMIDEERLAALGELDVQYYLPKPFTAEVLLDVVTHLAGRRPGSGGHEQSTG